MSAILPSPKSRAEAAGGTLQLFGERHEAPRSSAGEQSVFRREGLIFLLVEGLVGAGAEEKVGHRDGVIAWSQYPCYCAEARQLPPSLESGGGQLVLPPGLHQAERSLPDPLADPPPATPKSPEDPLVVRDEVSRAAYLPAVPASGSGSPEAGGERSKPPPPSPRLRPARDPKPAPAPTAPPA